MNAKASGLLKADGRHHGIIGYTPLLDIKGFDFQRSFIPDYLHSICLGVIKYLMMIWINGKKTDSWFISKNQMDILVIRMQQIKPPHEISRSQFNLKKIGQWKASQFRAFALYFYPVLDGILPQPYYLHFCSLSYTLHLLLQESAKKTAVRKTLPLCESFVRDVEILYGRKYVTYNFHLLPHLTPTALDWGLLWANATFIPEGFNGTLNSFVKGTQSVIEQMAHFYMMQTRLRNEAIDVMSKNTLPKVVLEMLHDLLCLPVGEHKKFVAINGVTLERVKLLGRPKVRKLTATEEVAIKVCFSRLSLNGWIDGQDCEFFPRLMLRHGSVYTTKTYTRSPNRINYCAFMNDGNFVFIENIIHFPYLPFHKCFLVTRVLGDISKTLIHLDAKLFDLEKVPGQTIKFVGSAGPLIVYDASELNKKGVLCGYNSLNDSGFATSLVNRFESD